MVNFIQFSFTSVSFCTVEHSLNMVSIMASAIKASKNPLQELFEVQVPFLFIITELTWWKAILSKWFNIVVTFAWSFMDLFVMIVSVGLAAQFKQLNTDLKRVKGQVRHIKFHFPNGYQILYQIHIVPKNTTNEYWILRRVQYRKIVHLVDTVDNTISTITFATFANNLFFCCIQLVRVIK